MSAPPAFACTAQHCITCSDEGVPMRIVRIDGRRGLALCADADGERHTVEIGLLDDPGDGASVLVHAGVAIAALEDFKESR